MPDKARLGTKTSGTIPARKEDNRDKAGAHKNVFSWNLSPNLGDAGFWEIISGDFDHFFAFEIGFDWVCFYWHCS
jgi:hypothetical protein